MLLWLAAADVSLAQGPDGRLDQGGFDSLRVPGGRAALARAAGLDGDAPGGGVLLDVIRILYEAPAGADPVRDARVNSLRAYLSAVAGVERARASLPNGVISTALAAQPASRRAAEDAVRAIGGEIAQQDGGFRVVLPDDGRSQQVRAALQEAGLDAPAIARAFDSGSAAALELREDRLPLPLETSSWERLVAPEPGMDGCLLTALLSDRRTALLYHGLMGLDAPTRAFLASDAGLLPLLLSGSRPDVFATLGRSIRVRDARIDVPGGDSAVEMWENLVGRRVREPASFILELLQRDGGRLALLYDAVDHLDRARQAFALGLATPATGAYRLRTLYDAFVVSLRAIDLAARPFRRVPADGVHLLSATRVLPSGRLPAPDGRRFWAAAMSESRIPPDPAREIRADARDEPVDAAWLLERVCVEEPARRQDLLARWLFGQRVFTGVPAASLPDALVALRGFARFRTLLLTLEKMGIADPATYAAAVRHAERIGDIGDREKSEAAYRQFQGALALLERVRFSRALTAGVAGRLVASLAAVPLSKDGEYLGGVGDWLEGQFLSALEPPPPLPGARADQRGPLESALLAAMAGIKASAPAVDVEWEGLLYRVDVGAAEFDRLLRIRRKQGGAGLDAVLAFSRESRRLAGPLPGLSAIPTRIAALTAAAEALEAPWQGDADAAPRLRQIRDLVAGATRELQGIRRPGDLAKGEAVSMPLRRASDRLLADVLVSLAYAPQMGDPDGSPLLAGDPALRHRFGADDRLAERRAAAPWRIPRDTVGEAGGWRATGSILALDVGLSALSLRRLSTDSLPPPPSVNDIDRSSLTATLVLANPFDVTDAGRDALAGAIQRGRARAEALAGAPSGLADVARDSGIGEWRRQVLTWVLRHEPARAAEYFSLSDLVRLGSAGGAPIAEIDAWGTSALAREGCLCLRYPESGGWETLAGRFGTALVAEHMPDLTLRLAEALARLGLPARLMPAVLAFATQDVLDSSRPAYLDDWAALAAAVRSLPESRIADHAAALTAGGPLIPSDRDSSNDVRH